MRSYSYCLVKKNSEKIQISFVIQNWFWKLNFDTSPPHQFAKFNNFLWICWFLTKKNFLILYPFHENSTTDIAIAHLNLHDRIQALEIQIFIAKLTVRILIRTIEKTSISQNCSSFIFLNSTAFSHHTEWNGTVYSRSQRLQNDEKNTYLQYTTCPPY